MTHRLQLLAKIIRLPLNMIPEQRGTSLREPSPVYDIDRIDLLKDVPLS